MTACRGAVEVDDSGAITDLRLVFFVKWKLKQIGVNFDPSSYGSYWHFFFDFFFSMLLRAPADPRGTRGWGRALRRGGLSRISL